MRRSQYSTANANRGAARETVPRDLARQESRSSIANGLRACGLAVKLHGTRRNRTSSRANDVAAGTAHNTLGGNREFFQSRPPPDGPRRPPHARPTPLVAAVPARGNDAIVRDGTPCRARWRDTAAPPAAATKVVPLRHSLRYSSDPEDDEGRTTARTPSTDRSAHDNEPGLAVAAKHNHAGPQTQGAPTPDGQVPAAELPLRAGML
jgi:hypothetical protein